MNNFLRTLAICGLVASGQTPSQDPAQPAQPTFRSAVDLVPVDVNILDRGGKFEDVRELVAGARGRLVYENGDPEAGIWTVGTVQGIIHDIPTAGELVERIVTEAEALISERLAGMMSRVNA